MKVYNLHGWDVSIAAARELQLKLAVQVSRQNEVSAPRLLAGVDISVRKTSGTATAAVVVLDYPSLDLVETRVVSGEVSFPYVPGLLSFRELPLTLAALEGLSNTPDLIMVDGQGYAHPRRMGYACHLGLFVDTPTIGCAKSLLCGTHDEPGLEPGDYSEIKDEGEVIGAALRTKAGIRPVYVSIGHKIDLPHAIYWVRQCCRSYRLPETTRMAHLAAGGNLKESSAVAAGYQKGEREVNAGTR
ncbi:MAG: deoxyribonuclease V [Chloroflexi bacterium]|nr:deoxyribonuclease V [Chloroflexota bacterium]